MKKFVVTLLLGAGILSINNIALAQGDASAGESKTAVCVACHGANGNESLLPNVSKLGGQSEKYLLKQLQNIKSGEREVQLMAGILNALNDQDLENIAAFYASQPAPEGAAAADEEALALGRELYFAGNAEIGVAACAACHSPTGQGMATAGYPALGGQDAGYTEVQLKAFRDGVRANDDGAVMRMIAERLNDAEISALASYVSGLRAL